MICIMLEIIFDNTLMDERLLGIWKREVREGHELLGQIGVEVPVHWPLSLTPAPDAPYGW